MNTSRDSLQTYTFCTAAMVPHYVTMLMFQTGLLISSCSTRAKIKIQECMPLQRYSWSKDFIHLNIHILC